MQWLIDLVIEAIGVPPCFIDRGDDNTWDYDIDDLTTDGAWHDLDLSGIVAEGATAVLLRVAYVNDAIGRAIFFRKDGNVNELNVAEVETHIAETQRIESRTVAVSDARVIEYKTPAAGNPEIDIYVRGWWL